MTKVLCFVTTSVDNLFWLDKCLYSIHRSIKTVANPDVNVDLVVCDFGKDSGLGRTVEKRYPPIEYIRNKDGSLQANVNIGFEMCKNRNYDFFAYFNDDVILNKYFLDNALEFFSVGNGGSEIGFLGGASQRGGWNEPVDGIYVPEPRLHIIDLSDIKRLNWEFSACMIPKGTIEKVGRMDPLFGRIGLCADNDYLFRIRKAGYRTVRYEGCTFFHAKAVTQSKLRDPYSPNDPWRRRAVEYMFVKWGVNIDDNRVTDEHCFYKPFNGADIKVFGEDTIIVNGVTRDFKGEFGV